LEPSTLSRSFGRFIFRCTFRGMPRVLLLAM
jgi:hypothetical protein